jgi:hypothetical protein
MWRLIYKTGIGLTTGFIGSHTVTHNYSVYTLTAPYGSLQHLPSLHTVPSLVACLPISQDPFACNSSLKTAARPEYSLVTAPVLVTARVTYIARERTPKKTPPPIPLLLYDVITGRDHKENASTVAWLSIVARLSVAIATVVNTCHIAYSMHVTIALFLNCAQSLG